MNYRKLLPTEFPLYTEHLLRLPGRDRYARFAGTVSDESIRRHCENMDWSRVVLIGAFNNGALVGVVELCSDRALWPGAAELAISVDEGLQSAGVGGQLTRRALTAARNRNICDIHMLCLSGNHRMRKLARRFNGVIETDGGESTIVLRLPPPNQFSYAQEAFEDGAGLLAGLFDAMAAHRMTRAAA
jgi:GNAT superfamily N-acetyltransferase